MVFLRNKLQGNRAERGSLKAPMPLKFTSLPAGKSIQGVKARSAERAWFTSPLVISVPFGEPFFTISWAYLFYSMLAAGLLYIGFRFYIKWRKVQKHLQAEHAHTLELEKLDKVKTRYFMDLVHELRNPLTLIKGPVSEIEQDPGDTQVESLAKQAHRQVEVMLTLLDQMLELERIDSVAEKIVFVRTDIVKVLKKAVEAYGPLANRQEIALSLVTDRSSFQMDFDPDKLQKILHNLLTNAFKFTPPGGRLEINFCTLTSPLPGHVVLTISDTGIGISAEDLPRIFDRFYQADSSLSRKYAGAGIGLSFVKELVRLHRGTIDAQSIPGEATSFRICLPIEQKERRIEKKEIPFSIYPDIGRHLFLSNRETTAASATAFTSVMPTLLLIEDHHELADFIADYLSDQYQVSCAYDGAEGYKQAILKVPDLIITDLMLPRMDGFTLTRELRANEVSSHIPLVMLTARSTVQDRIQGLSSGVNAFINKPFSPDELRLILKNLLNLRNSLADKFILDWKPGTRKVLEEVQKENSFYEKFTRIAEENLADENFGVNEMLREIGMSRTQLHRKIKATTGKSANELLRSIKLQKALLLLQSSQLPVAEVAARVGFGSASHFTKIFSEHYGFLPSEVKEKFGNKR